LEDEDLAGDDMMTAQVPEALHGARLDAAAASLFPAFSRSRLADWIKSGRLQRNHGTAKPRDKVAVSDRITLTPEYEDRVEWAPEALPLDLLYEDDHVIVLNKPAGLVVHPAAGHHSGTLVNRLLAHAPEMASLPRGGIVHRLDKDTSGVMLAAKSTLAHKSLVAQLAERTVSRHYSAVCRGTFSGGGTIDGPIGRHPTSRIKMAVVPDGKPAVTHYRIAERFGAHTHLDVSLESGRTHQIRVHLAWRKHPLIGDPVYGGRAMRPAGASDRLLSALQEFPRQALHARELAFLHPESGESMQFSTPIPEDLAELLGCLAEEDPA
jgi:23S rRNA pseudouridine1911/1915/1917 synthase